MNGCFRCALACDTSRCCVCSRNFEETSFVGIFIGVLSSCGWLVVLIKVCMDSLCVCVCDSVGACGCCVSAWNVYV